MLKKFYPIFSILLIIGCATISTFDQYAYQQSTSIKVDAINVMGLAAEDYDLHDKEAKAVKLEMDKIYEYEKNRPKNEITTLMWKKIMDTSGHLFGGFVKRWKTEKKLNQAFIDNEKDIIGQAFDQISQLESKKIKSVSTQ